MMRTPSYRVFQDKHQPNKLEPKTCQNCSKKTIALFSRRYGDEIKAVCLKCLKGVK